MVPTQISPWAVRAWPYQATVPGDKAWFAPQRRAAHDVARRYFRPRPRVLEEAAKVRRVGGTWLAVHYRAQDKTRGGQRRPKRSLDDFRPFVRAAARDVRIRIRTEWIFTSQVERFVETARDPHVFLATDDDGSGAKIRRTWSAAAASSVARQADVARGHRGVPAFKVINGTAHDDTNVQVLRDIYALASCDLLIHGFSAVSESAHYLNPALHNRSVNLDVGRDRGDDLRDFDAAVAGLSAGRPRDLWFEASLGVSHVV